MIAEGISSIFFLTITEFHLQNTAIFKLLLEFQSNLALTLMSTLFNCGIP